MYLNTQRGGGAEGSDDFLPSFFLNKVKVRLAGPLCAAAMQRCPFNCYFYCNNSACISITFLS